jgi:hypothetical protein
MNSFGTNEIQSMTTTNSEYSQGLEAFANSKKIIKVKVNSYCSATSDTETEVEITKSQSVQPHLSDIEEPSQPKINLFKKKTSSSSTSVSSHKLDNDITEKNNDLSLIKNILCNKEFNALIDNFISNARQIQKAKTKINTLQKSSINTKPQVNTNNSDFINEIGNPELPKHPDPMMNYPDKTQFMMPCLGPNDSSFYKFSDLKKQPIKDFAAAEYAHSSFNPETLVEKPIGLARPFSDFPEDSPFPTKELELPKKLIGTPLTELLKIPNPPNIIENNAVVDKSIHAKKALESLGTFLSEFSKMM